MNLRVRDIRLQVGTGLEPMGKVEKKGGEEISYRPGDDVSAFFCSIQRIFFFFFKMGPFGRFGGPASRDLGRNFVVSDAGGGDDGQEMSSCQSERRQNITASQNVCGFWPSVARRADRYDLIDPSATPFRRPSDKKKGQ
jgi:hypothetical protein